MGSGGGGSSGKVDYPAYMQGHHTTYLNSMDTLLGTGISGNPYTGVTAYDPDTELAAMDTAIGTLGTFIATLSESWITAQVAAQVVILADRWTNILEPRFQAGMRDINAVMTSAYNYGSAVALASLTAEAQTVGIELRKLIAQLTTEGNKTIAQFTLDTKRIKIIAKNEEEARQTELDDKEVRWPFDLYMYASNLLGAIGGGSRATGSSPSKAQTALGGAMSGAAMGTAISPGYGTAIGAVVGGLMGMFS